MYPFEIFSAHTTLVNTPKRYWLSQPIVLQGIRYRHKNMQAAQKAHRLGF